MVMVVYTHLAEPAVTWEPEPKAALSLARRDPDTVMEVGDDE